jgi:hypothetical protein
MILSNRDKKQLSRERGQDSKRVQAEQLHENELNAQRREHNLQHPVEGNRTSTSPKTIRDKRLLNVVRHLATEIGPRNIYHYDSLCRAAEYVENAFHTLGYFPVRQTRGERQKGLVGPEPATRLLWRAVRVRPAPHMRAVDFGSLRNDIRLFNYTGMQLPRLALGAQPYLAGRS